MAKERWVAENFHDLRLKLVEHPQTEAQYDRRTYNTPTVSEVAVIMATSDNTTNRDVVLTTQQGPLKHISELHPSYDSLAYPLFGANLGFQLKIRYAGDDAAEEEDSDNDNEEESSPQRRHRRQSFVTVREFYAFRLHRRPNLFNTLLFGGRLFHQYIVDMYAKYEQNTLAYINANQTKLRADVYQGLADVVVPGDDVDTSDIGRRVILPSSFVGGPRHMRQLFQDAMAIVRRFGKPSLFITVTCNPEWPEILAELEEGQVPQDRPDIIARVFWQKMNDIMDDLVKKGVLGKTLAYVHVIEFQKRGLPHAHILLILANGHQFLTVEDIDCVVSAEIPDPVSQPDLHQAVVKHNLHGPCGAAFPNCPCMKDGVCKKKYPWKFVEETSIVDGSFPIYRRRNNGHTHTKKGFTFDNRWVVPYNPFLSAKYQCHINVEVCGSVQAVKYLYKYIYKGHDRAMVEVERRDEIKEYIDARYVAACEGCWRLFAFSMHGSSHSVERLHCHLEGLQYVTYRDGEPAEEALSRNERTKLTAFFELCRGTSQFPKTLLYEEVPLYYSWNKRAKKWKRRTRTCAVVPRIYSANPSQGERFYL